MNPIAAATHGVGLRGRLAAPTIREPITEVDATTTGSEPAGMIPRYALDPDGAPHDTVIFYKELI